MNNMLFAPLYGNYRNRTFADIYSSFEEFQEDYKDSKLYSELAQISDNALEVLYYLLYARYGNSTIASSDENQFRYKVFSTIFMYGPTWEKRLELQKKIRNLGDDWKDALTIYNSAFNDGSAPSTQTIEEIDYINAQNTTRKIRSLPEKYSIIAALLETDVTEEFIGRFKKLFLTFVAPELPLWYETEDNNND